MRTDPFDALSRSRFFEGLSEASRRRLAEICFVREVPRREVLFLEGDEGHSMYLLDAGRVQLHKVTPDGREVVIRVVEPGETFAEVVLFEASAYPVSAVTLAAGTVVTLPRRGILRLLGDEGFRNDFLAGVMARLRYLTARIVELTTADVEERLLRFLADRAGGGAVLDLDLSKKDVAAAIGTTPETLSRTIQRLGEEGRLRWTGRRVEWTGHGDG